MALASTSTIGRRIVPPMPALQGFVPQSIAVIDDADMLIGQLYRAGAQVRPGQFRLWALRELRSALPFDGALWGTGTLETLSFHTITLLDLPPGLPPALEASREQNPLLPAILEHPGKPVTMHSQWPGDGFYASDLYRDIFKPHGIEHIMATGQADPRGGVYTLLTLYRNDRSQAFTADEQALHARMAYHLVNAASHLVFAHINRGQPDLPTGSAACVCDDQGVFHEVQAGFLDLLDAHYPGRDPHQLPFDLPRKHGSNRTIGKLCVVREPLGELNVLRAWPAGPLDALTLRERSIVNGVAHGLTFKEIARQVGLAPSTVSNHLYRVYDKLGVHSRSALAKLVHDNSQ